MYLYKRLMKGRNNLKNMAFAQHFDDRIKESLSKLL